MKEKSFATITFLAIAACFLWSTAFVAVKIGLKYSSPFYFSGLRFMLSGLVLLPFCGNIFTLIKTVLANIRMILVLGFLQTFLLYGIFFYTMTFISGALVAILIGAAPLITAITSHYAMDNDEMDLRKTLYLAIGIIGVVILSLSRKPWTGHGLKEFAGMLLLLLGSVSSAMGNILVAKEKKLNPVALNASQIFIGGFLLFVVSLVFEGEPVLITDPDFYIALAWLVFISSTAFTLWFVLLSTPGVKVSELNIWKFVIPLSGAGLSWLILPDENPELLPAAGMVFIVVSIILVNRYSLTKGNS
jgi:drug/metabolite transporter (DMT)-like permease